MSATTQEAPETLGPSLLAGFTTLSNNQTVPFVQYIRHVLPLDGYVFWLPTQQTEIVGSLHVSINERQAEDENISINTVVFTTQTQVQNFNEIDQNTIWVGHWNGLRFSFSRQGKFFRAAKLFHYSGEAVYPAMESQLVDIGSELSDETLIVSNSLPAWLAIRSYKPIWLQPPNPEVMLYPSFALPSNIRPPYGAVHINPDQTQALQGVPLLSADYTHEQLATDHVRVTLYGLTNDAAMAWFDTVNRYSLDTSVIGMMSSPVPRDGKRGQVGLDILAMQKIFDFDVAYNQNSVRNIARQLIRSVSATVQPRESF